MTLTPEEWTAIRLSLAVASMATLLALPVAIGVAYALSRWRFPLRTLLDALVHLPLVLPPVVTGIILLSLLGRRAPVGGFLAEYLGLSFSFRWTGAALAAAVMAFPLLVRPIRLAFDSIDRELESTASTLGASPPWRFALVTLPLALPGILSGAVLCFAKALGEFGATITFVSSIPGETQTLSLAIYAALQRPDGDAAAFRLTLVAVAIAMSAVLLSEILARRARRQAAGGA
ncbi:MAG: molybdate ABC transporter permease subunit [Hyphomicrobiaceae bacterium]